MVCADDIEEAKREAKRVAALPGLHGVILPLYPRTDPLNSDVCDPLSGRGPGPGASRACSMWRLATPRLSKPLGNDNPHIHGAYPAAMNDNFMGTYEALSKVIFGGMLDGSRASSSCWSSHESAGCPFFSNAPTTFSNAIATGASCSSRSRPASISPPPGLCDLHRGPGGIEARHRIGVDNIMWSSDYPHTDTTWPNSRKYIEDTFQGVNEQDRHKLLVGNAAKLYKL